MSVERLIYVLRRRFNPNRGTRPKIRTATNTRAVCALNWRFLHLLNTFKPPFGFSKPILASVNKNNEIIPLIHEKNIGFASQANDIVSFNNNLFTILSNSVLRKEQGKNALKLFNEQFTVEVATRQIIKNFQ
jgi:glycosyltransferase involved in cell wall biosynthesis